MSAINEKELREQDAWIAVNLFGWIKTDVKCHPSDNRTIGGFLYSPNGFNSDCNQASVVPGYHYDLDAAMQVLEKCVQLLRDQDREETVSVGCDDPYWIVEKTNCVPNLRVESNTLPLAICSFARKLTSSSADSAGHG